MKEVIEMFERMEGQHEWLIRKIAEAILNLHYPCKECGGSGKHTSLELGETNICFTCKGTGQGEKMLAVLAENQECPRNPISDFAKYWFEPCTKHKSIYENQGGGITILENKQHRFLCPECINEVSNTESI